MSVKPAVFDNPELFAEIFPDDVDINDICDCGRHKRKQVPGFNGKMAPRTKREFPDTDYKATFKPKNARPRSSKRPPPSPRDPNPPPMTFSTNQRSEFTKPNNPERVEPIKREEKYEPSTVPLESQTFYKQEYKPKVVFPDIHQFSPKPDEIRLPSAKFDPTTTNKTHYKQWVPEPSRPFAELPSFAGSILFPEKERLPESVTKHTYIKRPIQPTEPAKPADNNLKIEGSMMFDTTHDNTYRKIHGDHRSVRVKPWTELSTNLKSKDKFETLTQFRRDFPGFLGGQPLPPPPISPLKSTVDLKFDNRRSFSTEQRSIYKGHDVKTFPSAKSCKKTEEEYRVPSVAFETETSQRRDFKPIDIENAYPPPSFIPFEKLHTDKDAKFDDHTMSKEFFKEWPVQERKRYGDFHENRPYIPPMVKFEGESITKSTYKPKVAEPIQNYKPEFKTIDKSGNMELKTSYTDSYPGHKIKLCRAQIYLLQQEFKKWQTEQQNNAISVH
ncbi:hypothetical protein LOTGIDRAFT_239638 [Lottia gigantea]|uniref:Uncharacterized protein n=1 Tax=Lottia gigantea TaxID=225164 RepID=V3ZTS6_LOTGI|nr:hypothetical protein LOTGIDRAFT_239638 [Lottia gigantea]ESO85955.1 hypothetical protein LOTGIDRAFT_239638 [Lottia gigantea]